MEPRIVTRTHYQVDEPAYLRHLVLDCTSPTQSNFADTVAKRLAQQLSINPAAARYIVDLGRSLKLIDDNLVWTDAGHLLHAISAVPHSRSLELTEKERIFMFRVFLERDGAAFLFLLRSVLDGATIPREGQNWNELANQMFVDIYSCYLALEDDPGARVRLRQVVDRRTSKPFSGRSGSHQCFLHIQTMYRLGLLNRIEKKGARRYDVQTESSYGASQGLINALPDVSALERIIKERSWAAIAYATICRTATEASAGRTGGPTDRLAPEVRRIYDKVAGTGAYLCPIRTLVETVQIEQLAAGTKPVSFDAAEEELRELQQARPRVVRFHVDRQGRPAYIRLGDDFQVAERHVVNLSGAN